MASRFRQGRALFNGGENCKLANSEQLPDVRWHQPLLPVHGLVRLQRDLVTAHMHYAPSSIAKDDGAFLLFIIYIK